MRKSQTLSGHNSDMKKIYYAHCPTCGMNYKLKATNWIMARYWFRIFNSDKKTKYCDGNSANDPIKFVVSKEEL
jgi:hypothetical protein